MKEMNYQLIKAIQNDDVGEITQLPLWKLVVTGKNSSIAKEILHYCVDWDAHKILLELIKNNVFSVNNLESENDFIDQLIDKTEAKNYHLMNILLNIFAGDIPEQLAPRISMPIKSITTGLFFSIADSSGFDQTKHVWLIQRLVQNGLPYQALLESIITYENNKYLELLQEALKKADISFAQQCNKLRLLPKSYDADEILNNEKPELESLNQTLVKQDYVGFNHLLTQISDEDLAQLYLQASSQMGLHECLLMQIWFYGIHQNKFYEHILHSQDPIALFNTKNNVYLSSRLLIDYMQQEKTAIKPSNLPDYLNQFKVDAIDMLQLSLELDKENSLKTLMAYLSQDNYDEFVTHIQTLLSKNQEFFSNRLTKYLHQYGYVTANNPMAQNEEKSGLNQIPPYTWLDIYKNYLTDLKDQANFQTACKTFYNMAQSQQFNFDKMKNFQKYQKLLDTIQEIQKLPTHRFSSMYFKSYFYQFMRQTQFKYSPVKLIPWAPVANSIQMVLDVLMPIGLSSYGVEMMYQGWFEYVDSLAGSPLKFYGSMGLTVLALIYLIANIIFLRGQITNADNFQIRAFNEIIDHLNALHLFEHPGISKNMRLDELWNVTQQIKAEVELDPDVFKPHKNKFFSQYQSQLMFKGGEQLKPNDKKSSLEKALEEENTEIVINISDEDVNEKSYLLAYKY